VNLGLEVHCGALGCAHVGMMEPRRQNVKKPGRAARHQRRRAAPSAACCCQPPTETLNPP
jgi:hypothetical protein